MSSLGGEKLVYFGYWDPGNDRGVLSSNDLSGNELIVILVDVFGFNFNIVSLYLLELEVQGICCFTY